MKSEALRQDYVLAGTQRPLRAPGMPGGPPGSLLRVWFGVKWTCDTAAVLSAAVACSKTRTEVIAALPQIVDRLRVQYRGFFSMSCSIHQKMRSDSVSGIGARRD